MKESVIKLGVMIIFIGAITFLFGTIGEDRAYSTLIRAADEIFDNTLLIEAYEETRTAAFSKNLGLFIFMLGVGITFYGMAQEPMPSPTAMPPAERPWEQLPPQESSERQPPQRM